jgi:nickel transport protein
MEYQNGRTDRKGRFSFYPSVPGTWRVEANDGMGHKEVGVIYTQQQTLDGATSDNISAMNANQSAQQSAFLKTITGLSLILNLFLLFYLWKSRKMNMKQKI